MKNCRKRQYVGIYSKSNYVEWIARKKTMSHTFCNFPSSCLGDMQLLFLAYLLLVKSKLIGFVWTGKRSGEWSRKKIPLQLNCCVMSWFFFFSSHPNFLWSSINATSLIRVLDKIQISMQVCMKISSLLNSSWFQSPQHFICILYTGRWLSILILPFYTL